MPVPAVIGPGRGIEIDTSIVAMRRRIRCPGQGARAGSPGTGIDMMTPAITASGRSPDGGRGLARDARVRRGPEEAGRPYDVGPRAFEATKDTAHPTLHPFGPIPTCEQVDLVMFETGAIVLHIAQHSEALPPRGPDGRARAATWMFAALGTMEPPVLDPMIARRVESHESWAQTRQPLVMHRARLHLAQLSARLAAADRLDAAFGAGDLVLVSVLLRYRMPGLLDEHPNLAACVARGEARPACRRAFAAQRAIDARPADGSPAR